MVCGSLFLILTCSRPLQTSFCWQCCQLLGLWHYFNLKVEQLSWKKWLKFALLGNFFSDLFKELQISYKKWFQVSFIAFFKKIK